MKRLGIFVERERMKDGVEDRREDGSEGRRKDEAEQEPVSSRQRSGKTQQTMTMRYDATMIR